MYCGIEIRTLKLRSIFGERGGSSSSNSSLMDLVRDVVLVDLEELEVLAVDALHVAGLELEEVDLLAVLVACVDKHPQQTERERDATDGEHRCT